MKTQNNIKTLAEFKDEQYGQRGKDTREKLESGYESFKKNVSKKVIKQA